MYSTVVCILNCMQMLKSLKTKDFDGFIVRSRDNILFIWRKYHRINSTYKK